MRYQSFTINLVNLSVHLKFDSSTFCVFNEGISPVSKAMSQTTDNFVLVFSCSIPMCTDSQYLYIIEPTVW